MRNVPVRLEEAAKNLNATDDTSSLTEKIELLIAANKQLVLEMERLSSDLETVAKIHRLNAQPLHAQQ